MTTVIDEITQWFQYGRSRFAELVAQLDLPTTITTPTAIDRVLPEPSG